MKQFLSLGLASALALSLTACFDSDDDDDNGSATLSYSVQASLATPTSPQASSLLSIQSRAANCDAPGNYPAYSTTQGASGAPDNMTLYLRSIELTSSESSDRATLFESNSSTGDAIVIDSTNNGTVSLQDLATSVDVEPIEGDDGEQIEVEIPTGSFNQMTITFKNSADIKGCITENWQANSGFDCANNQSLCDLPPSDGEHTVCTVADLSIFDLVDTSGSSIANKTAAFEQFETNSAAETQVSLAQRSGDSSQPFDPDSDVTFNIEMDEISITDGDALDLTLAIDLNLLLRFDGNTRSDNDEGTRVDQHPLKGVMAGDGTLDYAYFHTVYLPDVMGVYIGEPGDVHGYFVQSCDDSNGIQTVDSWMTMIFDEDEDLLTGFVTPKSDAGMVVLKGNVNPTDASTRPSVENSDGSYDLLFGDFAGGGQLNDWSPLDAVNDNDTLESKLIQTQQEGTNTEGNVSGWTWDYTRKL